MDVKIVSKINVKTFMLFCNFYILYIYDHRFVFLNGGSIYQSHDVHLKFLGVTVSK